MTFFSFAATDAGRVGERNHQCLAYPTCRCRGRKPCRAHAVLSSPSRSGTCDSQRKYVADLIEPALQDPDVLEV